MAVLLDGSSLVFGSNFFIYEPSMDSMRGLDKLWTLGALKLTIAEDAMEVDRDIIGVGLVFQVGARALMGVATGVGVLAGFGTVFLA